MTFPAFTPGARGASALPLSLPHCAVVSPVSHPQLAVDRDAPVLQYTVCCMLCRCIWFSPNGMVPSTRQCSQGVHAQCVGTCDDTCERAFRFCCKNASSLLVGCPCCHPLAAAGFAHIARVFQLLGPAQAIAVLCTIAACRRVHVRVVCTECTCASSWFIGPSVLTAVLLQPR